MRDMRQIRRLFTLKHLLRVAALALVIWLAVVAAMVAGIYTTGEESNAEPADAIIVLGSGLRRDGRPGDALRRRSIWAAQLYNEGMAPAVICTGGIGDGKTRSEADACREVLESRGVPRAAIYLEEQSRSTEENAIYAREIMREQAWASAVLVTDSFHMLRANWVFDLYFDEDGIHHTRSPVPREWMRTYFYVRHSTREIVALHWQAFKELLGIEVTNVG